MDPMKWLRRLVAGGHAGDEVRAATVALEEASEKIDAALQGCNGQVQLPVAPAVAREVREETTRIAEGLRPKRKPERGALGVA